MTEAIAHPLPEPDIQFDFGANWAEFSHLLDEARVKEAIRGLLSLLSAEEITGKSFLDIGCGSGLHGLAALRLGAKSLTAIDVNPQSVATTQCVLEKFFPAASVAVIRQSILALDRPEKFPGPFDIVYSWGVLHHTGHMRQALRNAAALVSPGGKLVLAIYKKSPLCSFWRQEKRIYTGAPRWLRRGLDYAYATAYLTALLVTGHNPFTYVREYQQRRGMNWMTDVRDWLGGYPYESASADEMEALLAPLGFRLLRSQNTEKPKAAGLFGCGCGEYVFEKLTVR